MSGGSEVSGGVVQAIAEAFSFLKSSDENNSFPQLLLDGRHGRHIRVSLGGAG